MKTIKLRGEYWNSDNLLFPPQQCTFQRGQLFHMGSHFYISAFLHFPISLPYSWLPYQNSNWRKVELLAKREKWFQPKGGWRPRSVCSKLKPQPSLNQQSNFEISKYSMTLVIVVTANPNLMAHVNIKSSCGSPATRYKKLDFLQRERRRMSKVLAAGTAPILPVKI